MTGLMVAVCFHHPLNGLFHFVKMRKPNFQQSSVYLIIRHTVGKLAGQNGGKEGNPVFELSKQRKVILKEEESLGRAYPHTVSAIDTALTHNFRHPISYPDGFRRANLQAMGTTDALFPIHLDGMVFLSPEHQK
jgi:hypothetical protein